MISFATIGVNSSHWSQKEAFNSKSICLSNKTMLWQTMKRPIWFERLHLTSLRLKERSFLILSCFKLTLWQMTQDVWQMSGIYIWKKLKLSGQTQIICSGPIRSTVSGRNLVMARLSGKFDILKLILYKANMKWKGQLAGVSLVHNHN